MIPIPTSVLNTQSTKENVKLISNEQTKIWEKTDFIEWDDPTKNQDLGNEAEGSYNRHTGYWRWFKKPQYCRFIRIYPLKSYSHEGMRIALTISKYEKYNIDNRIGQTDETFKLNGPNDKMNIYRSPASLPGDKVIVKGSGSRTYEWMMKINETANRFMRIFTVGPGGTVKSTIFCLYLSTLWDIWVWDCIQMIGTAKPLDNTTTINNIKLHMDRILDGIIVL